MRMVKWYVLNEVIWDTELKIKGHLPGMVCA